MPLLKTVVSPPIALDDAVRCRNACLLGRIDAQALDEAVAEIVGQVELVAVRGSVPSFSVSLAWPIGERGAWSFLS